MGVGLLQFHSRAPAVALAARQLNAHFDGQMGIPAESRRGFPRVRCWQSYAPAREVMRICYSSSRGCRVSAIHGGEHRHRAAPGVPAWFRSIEGGDFPWPPVVLLMATGSRRPWQGAPGSTIGVPRLAADDLRWPRARRASSTPSPRPGRPRRTPSLRPRRTASLTSTRTRRRTRASSASASSARRISSRGSGGARDPGGIMTALVGPNAASR